MAKKDKIVAAINQIFSPAAPIDDVDLFVGRIEQLTKIKATIEERGQHAVIYGNRGAGKTSLANIACELFNSISSAKVICNRSDTFATLWEKALKKTRFIIQDSKIGFKDQTQERSIQLQLPDVPDLKPGHIEELFQEIYSHIVFVFDEFDSITDKETKTKMADTLKTFSDNVPNITVVIVGIATSVDELIGENPSIERCIRQIYLPEMNQVETKQIIQNSLRFLKLGIDEKVISQIVDYSAGFPNYTHLLCKYAALRTVEQDKDTIATEQLEYAVQLSIENSNQSLLHSYSTATKSAREKTQFEDIIFACTMVETDEHKTFTPEAVLVKFNELTQRDAKKESINYNLGMLCKDERGKVLEKFGPRNSSRYKFKNPLMKAFVKLKMHKITTPN